jgi:hypothetical protein
MEKSPDQIVADIDRKQNEEDKDLIPRAGRMIKEKFMELMTSKPKEEKESVPYELMVFMVFNDKVSWHGCLIFP